MWATFTACNVIAPTGIKVTTSADGRLRLTVTAHNAQAVYAYLYDNDGLTLLEDGYTSGTAAVVNKDGFAAGTYYVRIKAFTLPGLRLITLADQFVYSGSNQ